MGMAFAEHPVNRHTMERLRENIGREVTVEYVLLKRDLVVSGTLTQVHDFNKLVLEKSTQKGDTLTHDGEYLMAGWNSTIRSVKVDGTVVYDNSKNVPFGFRIKTQEESRAFREASFGTEIADEADKRYGLGKFARAVEKVEKTRMQKIIGLLKRS